MADEYGSATNPIKFTSDGKPMGDPAVTPDATTVNSKEPTPVVPVTPVTPVAPTDDVIPNLQAPPTEYIPVSGSQTVQDIADLLTSKNVTGAADMINELNDSGELSLSSQLKLVDGLGPEVASIVTRQLAADVASAKAAGTAAKNEVLDYAAKELGTSDAQATWNDLQAFANSPAAGLSPEDLSGLSAQLTNGGFGAKLAVDALVRMYKQSTNFTQHADLVQGQANLSQAFEPLSAQAYSEQMDAVARKYGYASREAEVLRQQRQRTVKYN